MQAGSLRYTIAIFQPGAAKDAFGQVSPSGSTLVLTTRAAISAASGREGFAQGAGFTELVTHQIVIRYPHTVLIRNGMTIRFGTRNFVIQYLADPTELKRQLKLLCLEINQ